ncbi:hypothetical protein FE257_007096 [Aspergillus nanangensis]|uniref:Uncharacterized protein n=1 Tax=Aspergillus nanangensis TaxID=2582783 RepID=A0AAD4GVL2_ASPNN|nr:hypothetical protein FE257_007096 [Aspergillus nanangensis]
MPSLIPHWQSPWETILAGLVPPDSHPGLVPDGGWDAWEWGHGISGLRQDPCGLRSYAGNSGTQRLAHGSSPSYPARPNFGKDPPGSHVIVRELQKTHMSVPVRRSSWKYKAIRSKFLDYPSVS